MKFTIPIPDKVSLNTIYAGVHFKKRLKLKKLYELAAYAAEPRLRPYDGKYPVHVHYHFRVHGKPLDISNYAYMQKMTEDTLVAFGVLPDDNPTYVRGITITAEKDQADEVEVTITPVCA